MKPVWNGLNLSAVAISTEATVDNSGSWPMDSIEGWKWVDESITLRVVTP